ncbi:G-protein beta WD-40 repeat [Crocosphaera watsonii WH 0402]|uniref:G-protein beta WD-40 repeat n=1 Tax=Crocosphaera watsonii WH 0402 TaxID=1284629 RepID=T2JQV8_CROWT|nr:hypothetical protein [Crocosphaera watsonii]CCQ66937.1 G-protein beta WD-40 repeat [Crocosphaera watsonii WH 0402]
MKSNYKKKTLPKPPKPKNNKLRNGLIAVGGILLLLAAYPSYIFLALWFFSNEPFIT